MEETKNRLHDEVIETEFDFSDSASRLWRPAFLCVVLIALELLALLSDFSEGNPSDVAARSRTIARFDSGSNSVRKKNSGTIAWFLPEAGEAIRNRDSILTLSDSQASVSFNDGSTMQVAPDSLVFFEEHALNLLEGSIENSSTLAVKVGDTTIANPKGDAKFKVSRTKSGGMVVKVTAGSVAVMKGDRKIASVDTTQAAAIDGEDVKMGVAEVTPEPLKFKLDAASSAVVSARDDSKAPLSLEVQAEYDPKAVTGQSKTVVRFEMAKDANFESVLASQESEMDDAALTAANGHASFRAEIEKLEDGDYFWRARIARHGLELAMDAREVHLRTRATPELEGPGDGEKSKKGKLVKLEWKVDEDRTKPEFYEVEISETADFSTAVQKSASKTNAMEWKPSKRGVYYWRVRSVYGNVAGQNLGSSRWSDQRRLEIVRKDKLRPPKMRQPKIRVLSPTSKTSQSKSWEFFSSAWGAEPGKQGTPLEVQMSWEAVDDAVGYRVQISQDKGFEKLLVDKKTNATSIKDMIHVQKPDALYFRVAAVDDEGETGFFSDAEKIELERFDPEIKAKIASQKEVENWRVNLGLGAAYHSRNFKNDANPKETLGAALIPAYGSCTIDVKLGITSEFTIHGSLLAEKAEATNLPKGIAVDKHGVPLVRAWTQIGWGNPDSPTNIAIGAYGATSHQFSWAGVKLTSEQKMLLGLHLEIGSRRVRRKNALRWRLDLGAYAVGGKGVDLGGELAWALSARKKDGAYRGFYFGFEPLGRFADIETYFGAVAKVGYEF